MNLLYIGLSFLTAGLIRYHLSKWIDKVIKTKANILSLTLNILVCFIIGLLMVILADNNIGFTINLNINNILISFFIAFSVFSYKTVYFLKRKMLTKASTNIFYNLFLGLVFLTIGNLIGKSL